MQIKNKLRAILLQILGYSYGKELLVVFIALVFFWGGYLGLIKSAQIKNNEALRTTLMLNARLTKMQQTIADTTAKQVKIQNYFAIDLGLSRLAQKLNYAALIQEIFLLSKKAGFEVQQLKPGETQQENGFSLFPFQITLHGCYQNMTYFTALFNQANFLLLMPSFTLKSLADGLVLEGNLIGYQAINLPIPAKAIAKKQNFPLKSFRIDRDPFIPPGIGVNNKQVAITQITANELQYIGTIQDENDITAIVVDLQGYIYHLKIGDQFGLKSARVKSITADAIVASDATQNIYRRN